MYSNNFIQQTLLQTSRTLLRINIRTNEVYNYKLEGQICSTADIPTDGKLFWESLMSSNLIHPADVWQFKILSTPQLLIQLYRELEEGAVMVYRYKVKNRFTWFRMDIIFPDQDSDILLISRKLDRTEALIAGSFLSLTKKVGRIGIVNLSSNTCEMIHDLFNSDELIKSGMIHNLAEEIIYISKHRVHPDDADLYLKRASSEYILDWFEHNNNEYNHYYRRLIDNVYRWVHLYIIKTDNYQEDNKEFYFFVEDAHDIFLRLLDIDNMSNFMRHYKLDRENDLYYSNLLKILDGLTSEYLDFYMVDLEKDLYVKYKVQSRVANDYLPSVAPYTKSSEDYIRKNHSGKEAEFLLRFSSSQKLRKLIMDRPVIEYSFTTSSGLKVKTICQKLESSNGIPTKVLCKTIPADTFHKLIVHTFGNFDVLTEDGKIVTFGRKQSKQLFAYLIDKQGYPVTSKDIVVDILEKPATDINAVKYVSTLVKRTMDDLEKAGYPNVIIKEQKTLRVDTSAVICDYYQLLNGDFSALSHYHNEYMKEYSWAEDTNAEISMMIDDM